MVPHFGRGGGVGGGGGGQEEAVRTIIFFCGFLKKMRVKCQTCVVVDKTRTTNGHGLRGLTDMDSWTNGPIDNTQTA